MSRNPDGQFLLFRARNPEAGYYNVCFYEDIKDLDQPQYRVDRLMHRGGNTLIVAQNKVGKTTLALNIVKSLVTGNPVLGLYETSELNGTVAYLNAEVSDRDIGAWATDLQIPRQRLVTVGLRGRANPFTDDGRLLELATHLRRFDVEAVVVDPFGVVYPKDDQNDPGLVQGWLNDLSLWVRDEVGATEIILVAHAGKTNRTEARGASSLEGWPDSILRLSKGGGRRSFSADGRDVDTAAITLDYDERTRLLTASPTKRKAASSKSDAGVRQKRRSSKRLTESAKLNRLWTRIGVGNATDAARQLIETQPENPLIARYAERPDRDSAVAALSKKLRRTQRVQPAD